MDALLVIAEWVVGLSARALVVRSSMVDSRRREFFTGVFIHACVIFGLLFSHIAVVAAWIIFILGWAAVIFVPLRPGAFARQH